jgi:MFS family permease
MVLLDGTITIVALPSIGGGLRFSEQGLQWVLSAYALTFGGLLLLGGRAADLPGRRRVFMAGAVLAGIGLALAFLLPGRPRTPAHELPEPDPAADTAAARRGDQVRNDMSEQRTGSYHPRRLRRR